MDSDPPASTASDAVRYMATAFGKAFRSLYRSVSVLRDRGIPHQTMASIRCHLIGIWRLLDARVILLLGVNEATITPKTMASIRCHLIGIWRLLDA